MPVEHYDKVLYPLQDRVIALFLGSPFYLTGGTALSRGYYHHRYSDDLDYFVNDHPDFLRIAERQIVTLDETLVYRRSGFWCCGRPECAGNVLLPVRG